MCKYLVGIAVRFRILKVPLEARNVPIGQKRPKGRPAKANKALEYQ